MEAVEKHRQTVVRCQVVAVGDTQHKAQGTGGSTPALLVYASQSSEVPARKKRARLSHLPGVVVDRVRRRRDALGI